MSETPAVKQQKLQEEHMLTLSRKYQRVFSGPAGEEVLDHLLYTICRIQGQLPPAPIPAGMTGLPVPTGEAALYWGGRGDVGRAVRQLIEYDPAKVPNVVVKTKRDGQ